MKVILIEEFCKREINIQTAAAIIGEKEFLQAFEKSAKTGKGVVVKSVEEDCYLEIIA